MRQPLTPQFDLFPDGKRRAIVLSFDDGSEHDRRLVALLNRYRLRATFFLNSGRLDQPGTLRSDEVRTLLAGHEVACHTVSHASLPHVTHDCAVREILDDRRHLESLMGAPVRGLAYPGGAFDDRVAAMLPVLGIAYARTTQGCELFHFHDDFYRWRPTCHVEDAINRYEQLRTIPEQWRMQVFHVWGHSSDLHASDTWGEFERFCAMASGDPAVWYTTLIELADYVRAARSVRSTVDGSIVHNPSAIALWFSLGDEAHMLEPGQTLQLH